MPAGHDVGGAAIAALAEEVWARGRRGSPSWGRGMNGWDEFTAMMRDARARLEDQWAPIALVCYPARQGSDGATEVRLLASGTILWPASIPVAERGPILERLAQPYRDGTVLRSDQSGRPV